MKPLLSIVIPNYNNSKYLDDCVGEILKQTYRPLEVLLVDDCSTDDSRRKIEEYTKAYPWIKGIFLKENGGVSHARNTGAAEALGEYITFLDADDYYINPEKLNNEMNLILNMEKAGKKNIGAFSKLRAVDSKGEYLWDYQTRKRFDRRILSRDFLSQKNIQLPRDYCLRRQLFLDTGGYTEGQNLYEDTEILLKISEKCEFVCTDETGSAYRITAQGLSSAAKEKHKAVWKTLRAQYMPTLPVSDRIWVYGSLIKNESISLAKQICKDILNMLGLRKKRAWE